MGANKSSTVLRKGKSYAWFTIGWLLWVYICLKLFVVDIDVIFLESLAPNFTYLLKFKILFILLVLTAYWRRYGFWSVAFRSLYVIFIPLVTAWSLSRLLVRNGNWNLLVAIADGVFSFFSSVQHFLLISTLTLISLFFILFVPKVVPVTVAGCMLFFLVIYQYGVMFLQAFKPSPFLRMCSSILRILQEKNWARSFCIEEAMRGLPLVQYSESQKKIRRDGLQTIVFFNTIIIFLAKRLREFQRTGVAYIFRGSPAIITWIFTVVCFWGINLAIHKIDVDSFRSEVSPDKFTFFFYSFKAMFFSQTGIVANSNLARSVEVVQNLCSLFIGGVFFSMILPGRNAQYLEDLNSVISDLEAQSSVLKNQMISEFLVEDMSDAIQELQTDRTEFVSFIEMFHKSI